MNPGRIESGEHLWLGQRPKATADEKSWNNWAVGMQQRHLAQALLLALRGSTSFFVYTRVEPAEEGEGGQDTLRFVVAPEVAEDDAQYVSSVLALAEDRAVAWREGKKLIGDLRKGMINHALGHALLDICVGIHEVICDIWDQLPLGNPLSVVVSRVAAYRPILALARIVAATSARSGETGGKVLRRLEAVGRGAAHSHTGGIPFVAALTHHATGPFLALVQRWVEAGVVHEELPLAPDARQPFTQWGWDEPSLPDFLKPVASRLLEAGKLALMLRLSHKLHAVDQIPRTPDPAALSAAIDPILHSANDRVLHHLRWDADAVGFFQVLTTFYLFSDSTWISDFLHACSETAACSLTRTAREVPWGVLQTLLDNAITDYKSKHKAHAVAYHVINGTRTWSVYPSARHDFRKQSFRRRPEPAPESEPEPEPEPHNSPSDIDVTDQSSAVHEVDAAHQRTPPVPSGEELVEQAHSSSTLEVKADDIASEAPMDVDAPLPTNSQQDEAMVDQDATEPRANQARGNDATKVPYAGNVYAKRPPPLEQSTVSLETAETHLFRSLSGRLGLAVELPLTNTLQVHVPIPWPLVLIFASGSHSPGGTASTHKSAEPAAPSALTSASDDEYRTGLLSTITAQALQAGPHTGYKFMFRLLFRIKTLRFDLNRCRRGRRTAADAAVCVLLYRMSSFLCSLETYLTYEVVAPAAEKFESVLVGSHSVSIVAAAHEEFLESCVAAALGRNEAYLKLLEKVFLSVKLFSEAARQSLPDQMVARFSKQFDERLAQLLEFISSSPDDPHGRLPHLVRKLDFNHYYRNNVIPRFAANKP